jgi:type II secretory pathway predicted ATPase ExeA
MFKQFFEMRFNPFDKEIETGSLYESEDFKELGLRLKYMQENRGICLLVGEPGSGKTTAIRKFVSGLGPSLFNPCYLSLTTLTVNDFYGAVCALLGEEPKHRKIDMYRQIQTTILSLYSEQKVTPVIIVDEVHMASSAILDDIQMLFNFRMDSQNPFILILSGQPAIRNKPAINMCYPLRQRIGIKYSMQGLTLTETEGYLKSRMELAGVNRDVFSHEAIVQIHTTSNGYPRNINNTATHSLMYCTGKKQSVVDEEAVYQANVQLAI